MFPFQDVPSLFCQCQQDFRLVDLDTLVPHLKAYSLLPDGENYHLSNKDLAPQEKRMKLADFMSSKGPAGLRRFLCALAEAKQYLGHRLLLSVLMDACKGKTKLHHSHCHSV